MRVETGAVLTGVLLAFHDVLCARGTHKPRSTRTLVRITQRLAFRTISTRRRGAVILQLAVLPGVAGRTGTRVAIQTPQRASAAVETGVRVTRVGHRNLAQ